MEGAGTASSDHTSASVEHAAMNQIKASNAIEIPFIFSPSQWPPQWHHASPRDASSLFHSVWGGFSLKKDIKTVPACNRGFDHQVNEKRSLRPGQKLPRLSDSIEPISHRSLYSRQIFRRLCLRSLCNRRVALECSPYCSHHTRRFRRICLHSRLCISSSFHPRSPRCRPHTRWSHRPCPDRRCRQHDRGHDPRHGRGLGLRPFHRY